MMLDPGPEEHSNPDDDWADCPLIAQTLRMEMRGKRYYTVRVKTPKHDVSVYVSPQGRSVRVYLDGALMSEEPAELHKRLAGDS
jgi:hypothetical protein